MKTTKIILIIIGVLLLANGGLNFIDDSVLLSYDITSILAGIGFVFIGFSKR